MSLNSLILGKFTRGKSAGTDAKLLPVHFQILSIFYLNFALTLLVIMFEGGTLLFMQLPVDRFLTVVCLFGSILSLILLKKGYYEAAGTIVLIYVHLVDYFTMYTLNLPLAGIFGILCYINLSYFVATSKWIIAANALASLIEISLHVREVMEIFQVVLTEDQLFQIRGGMVPVFVAFFYMSGLAAIQHMIYSHLCNQAIVNYERSEELTKEVMNTVEVKDGFISSLSHEVRNVLNSLNGSIDHLLDILDESAYKQILENARLSAEILLNLVNNALDGAKIKADKLELNYSNSSFDDVVRKTLIINSQSLKNKNIFAQAYIDSNLPPKLRIDSGRLMQIMINLISNAIKFTSENGQIRIHVSWHEDEQDSTTLFNMINETSFRDDDNNESITPKSGVIGENSIVYEDSEEVDLSWRIATRNLMEFSTEEDNKHQKNLTALTRSPSFHTKGLTRSQHPIHSSEHWIIKKVRPGRRIIRNHNNNGGQEKQDFGFLKVQVSDTGCGIPEQTISKLFKMYARGEKNGTNGSGLGLWICKQLCQKMNGQITVRSKEGNGSDFIYYIPVRRVVVQPNVPAPKSPRSSDKVNALVVDDFQFNRNLHKLLLEREGVQVTLACDGKEALEKYKEKGDGYFNMIFMDINMPEMDGITSAKKIREWEEMNGFGFTSIYFISGDYFNENEILAGFKNGSNVKKASGIRFMRKPVELDMITKIVEKHQSSSTT